MAASDVHTPDVADEVADIAEPVPAWARDNADDLLKFLFLSPRPCAELDRLIGTR